MPAPHALRLALAAGLGAAAASTAWWLTGPRQPVTPNTTPATGPTPDAALVTRLLEEDLADRRFPFAAVVEAASGQPVRPLDRADPAHARVLAALDAALAQVTADLGAADSPVRSLRRINEASRFFEDGLRARLDAAPGLRCAVPPNRRGDPQRSGYPDLRVLDEPSGAVFYLDPKLVERGAWASTLRSFYFEPKRETLKVTEPAVHLLVAIEHDGHDGAWSFPRWQLIDLSPLQVRLKAEFQASNSDLYPPTPNSKLQTPRPNDR